MQFSVRITTILFLILAGTGLYAQTLIGGKLQVFDAATPYVMFLSPYTPLPSNINLTLPASSGTLLVNEGLGVSNAWLRGGNNLAGPADNRLGSTSAHDVILIAGGGSNNRLTLVSSSNAVTNHDGGEFRFAEPVAGGTDYSAFKAGTQGASIVYTLPVTAPTVNQVLTATAVSGQDVTLGWQGASGWLLGGNTGITPTNNIIGIAESNTNPLRFYTNNTEQMQIASDGLVAIGTTPVTGYTVAVNGDVHIGNTTSGAIVTNVEAELRQDGDVNGYSSFKVHHRNGSNGALLSTDPAVTSPQMAEIGFKPGSGTQSNLRVEYDNSRLRNSANNSTYGEFQLVFDATNASPTYSVSFGTAATSFEVGNVGIGKRNPSQKFTVGASEQFSVNSTGDLIRINNVPYTWPAANAAANGYVLSSTTGGALSWVKASSVAGASGRVMITGNGTADYVINDAAVTATSIILVTLENGLDAAATSCTVSARVANTSFTITTNVAIANPDTKYVNYTIIN